MFESIDLYGSLSGLTSSGIIAITFIGVLMVMTVCFLLIRKYIALISEVKWVRMFDVGVAIVILLGTFVLAGSMSASVPSFLYIIFFTLLFIMYLSVVIKTLFFFCNKYAKYLTALSLVGFMLILGASGASYELGLNIEELNALNTSNHYVHYILWFGYLLLNVSYIVLAKSMIYYFCDRFSKIIFYIIFASTIHDLIFTFPMFKSAQSVVLILSYISWVAHACYLIMCTIKLAGKNAKYYIGFYILGLMMMLSGMFIGPFLASQVF